MASTRCLKAILIIGFAFITVSVEASRLSGIDWETDNEPAQPAPVRKRGARKFIGEEYKSVPPRGSCRLGSYIPRAPRYGRGVLCDGSSPAGCFEPCIPGYTLDNSRARPLCQQQCPSGTGAPSQFCSATRTCVRPGELCPRNVMEVPFQCPPPEMLIGSCVKQQYQAAVVPKPPSAPCAGLMYRDFIGRWRCAEATKYEACAPGYEPAQPELVSVVTPVGIRRLMALDPPAGSSSSSGSGSGTGFGSSSSSSSLSPLSHEAGYCHAKCPPWMVDCGGSCHMPGVTCALHPTFLCSAVSPRECQLRAREALARRTACGAEGYRSPGSCPLTLRLHGGCGGGRLQVASALRSQGSVKGIEAWWGLAHEHLLEAAAAAAGARSWGVVAALAAAAEAKGGEAAHVLLALRLTMTDGTTHVLGNESLAATSPPTSSFLLSQGEVLTRLGLWSSRMAADAAGLSPVVAGLSFTTNLGNNFTLGEPPELGLPDVKDDSNSSGAGSSSSSSGGIIAAEKQLAADVLAHATQVAGGQLAAGDSAAGAGQGQGQELAASGTATGISGASNAGGAATAGTAAIGSSSSSSSSGGDGVVVGGSGLPQAESAAGEAVPGGEAGEHASATAVWLPTLELSRAELGTGVVVGMAAFSSGEVIHALGLLLLDEPSKSEL